MSYHFPDLPTPSPETRADGWTPARQRRFLETLAATGVIRIACEAVRITPRSAYNLRIRRDGAAFRLGWDAAILIARARLADDLMARAITGQTETIRKDEENFEITRHRHDNRLAMSMLARLDRMADSPAEGTDAALARIVAQDFAAYCDMLCPADLMAQDVEAHGLPRPGAEPSARHMDDARLLDGTLPDAPVVPEPVLDAAAAALSPGASAALFVAVRMALHNAAATPAPAPAYPPISLSQERCELLPERPLDLAELPPEEAAAHLRGIWWDEGLARWRTDFPAPPGFDGDESDECYDIDNYERDLSDAEETALHARMEAERQPYEDAAARARDAYFSRDPADPIDGEGNAATG